MDYIKYDFSTFSSIFANIISKGKADSHDTIALKKELNKFFKDGKCKEVYYTQNEDKMFFGMKIIANIDTDNIYDYLTSNDRVRIMEYMIEIDSKLLNPILGLTEKELTAIILHEVGHMINDTTPMEDAKKYLTSYLADNKETLKMSESIHYKEILAYGLKDFLSKDRSMFYTNDEDEILSDNFVRMCGYGKYLESAMKKILKNNPKLYADSDVVTKFAAFGWTMRLYRNLGVRRVGALHTITKAKQITGSKLEKMELENVARRINRIDDESLMESSDLKSKVKAKMRKARYDTMRSLDDDYYELNMRIRNVEDEEDALYLMRQINNHLGLIDDYINSEDLDDKEKKRWFDNADKFRRLRENLSKATTYKSKTYGIYVNYPDIKEDNY